MNGSYKILIFILFQLVFKNAFPQQFKELNLNILGTAWGRAIWGDCNNDKKLDILIDGLNSNNKKTAKIYFNNGNSNYSDLPIHLIPVFRGDAKWGDLNEDGFSDIVYCGIDSNFKQRTIIYLNNKENGFSYFKDLDGVSNGKIIIRDFNNDHKNDILVIGRTDTKRETFIYFAKENRIDFVKIPIKIKSLIFPTIASINFNSDSLPDLIVSGRNSSFNRVTNIYVNKNNGNFELIDTKISNFSHASISVCDMDMNGFDDILISGGTRKGLKTKLYLNNKGILSEVATSFVGIHRGDNSFIDYDSDGDMDILISGYNDNKPITKLYTNDGSCKFKDTEEILEGVYDGSVSIGDFDADGDQDILLNGRTSSNNCLLIIYKNLKN